MRAKDSQNLALSRGFKNTIAASELTALKEKYLNDVPKNRHQHYHNAKVSLLDFIKPGAFGRIREKNGN